MITEEQAVTPRRRVLFWNEQFKRNIVGQQVVDNYLMCRNENLFSAITDKLCGFDIFGFPSITLDEARAVKVNRDVGMVSAIGAFSATLVSAINHVVYLLYFWYLHYTIVLGDCQEVCEKSFMNFYTVGCIFMQISRARALGARLNKNSFFLNKVINKRQEFNPGALVSFFFYFFKSHAEKVALMISSSLMVSVPLLSISREAQSFSCQSSAP